MLADAADVCRAQRSECHSRTRANHAKPHCGETLSDRLFFVLGCHVLASRVLAMDCYIGGCGIFKHLQRGRTAGGSMDKLLAHWMQLDTIMCTRVILVPYARIRRGLGLLGKGVAL